MAPLAEEAAALWAAEWIGFGLGRCSRFKLGATSVENAAL